MPTPNLKEIAPALRARVAARREDIVRFLRDIVAIPALAAAMTRFIARPFTAPARVTDAPPSAGEEPIDQPAGPLTGTGLASG